MNIRSIFVILSLAFLVTGNTQSAEIRDRENVLFGEKEVCLSDGNSLYIFHPDGQFSLEPLGMSGRTIKGRWFFNLDERIIHITGLWSWINGLSSGDDFREMDIYIGHFNNRATDHNSLITSKVHSIQDAYFVIDRLEKKDKGEPVAGGDATR